MTLTFEKHAFAALNLIFFFRAESIFMLSLRSGVACNLFGEYDYFRSKNSCASDFVVSFLLSALDPVGEWLDSFEGLFFSLGDGITGEAKSRLCFSCNFVAGVMKPEPEPRGGGRLKFKFMFTFFWN